MIRLSISILLLVATSIVADEPLANSVLEKQNLEAALKLTRESAAKYEMSLADEATPLKLREQPILRWSNPEVGQVYGNVFLWTRGGRPEVVGSLFKWFSPFSHMSHEFHSLSGGELSVNYEDHDVWKTAQPGVAFSAVPKAGEVAATPAARLLQMRQMARQFSARSVSREGLKLELRQLTQPVYRYELDKDSGDLLDGALFTFVQGTDPEVWLMLEARKVEDLSAAKWQFAIARMNSIELTVEHLGQQIWHCDVMPFKEVGSHKWAYTNFRFDQP